MYARVAVFEGGSAEAMKRDAELIKSSSADGPPPGVPANGITCLYDYESGKSIAIVFFETEEDMKAGERSHERDDQRSPGGRNACLGQFLRGAGGHQVLATRLIAGQACPWCAHAIADGVAAYRAGAVTR
ncbi:MAG: hypothetical protein ABWZ63_07685 [Thermoleophilaceae bacterium]